MLVLSRKKDEIVVVDLREFGLGLVEIMVVKMRENRVRLGIECQRSIPVHRMEVFQAILRETEKSRQKMEENDAPSAD